MIIFDEYLRSKSALSVLFQEEYFDLKTVQSYLKSKPEFAWMVDIKNRHYEHVKFQNKILLHFFKSILFQASLSTLQQVAETIGKRQVRSYVILINQFIILILSIDSISDQ